MVEVRTPPNSREAEQAVIGACLLSPSSFPECARQVTPDDFYEPRHGKVWQAMADLEAKGVRWDSVIVLNELRETGKLNEVGGEQYLAEIASTVPSSAGADEYAAIVLENASRRALIHSLTDATASAYVGGTSAEDLITATEKALVEIRTRSEKNEPTDWRSVMDSAVQQIEDAASGSTFMRGIGTGLLELDQVTGGPDAGQLIIVAGRPSMGKTSLARCIAYNAGEVERRPVLYFTLEESRENMVRALLSQRAGIDFKTLSRRRSYISNEDLEKVKRAATEIGELPIFIDDDPQLSPMSLRAKAKRLKATQGDLALIVVDYIQLMRVDRSGRRDSREQEVSALSRALKLTARELECPVVALAQLNRQAESRENRRPRMSDLRESGSIEQDADGVWLLYRDEYYDPDTTDRGVAEIIVAKQRNGPTGTVKTRYVPERVQFQNLAHPQDDDDHGFGDRW